MKKSLLLMSVMTALLGYFSFLVEERSPTEGLITDEKNLAVMEDREVEKRRSKGFDPGEIMVFFFDTSSPKWFQSYRSISEPQKGLKNVLDLFWAPDFKISDDGLITGNPIFVRGHDPPKDWCAQIVGDPVLEAFAMKDCSGVFSFHFLSSEETEKNEIEYVRKIVAFLEQGRYAPFWNLWDLDIHYAFEGMSGACWMLGRYIIHWGLTYSTFVLWTAGIFLFLLPLFLANFKSWRLACLAILHIIAAFVWMRGLMGLFGVRESIHTLIGYAPLLVCGPSFLLYAYHGKKKYGSVITTAAFLAILGFAMLFTFQVRHIQELALSAIFGIASIYVLAMFSFARFVDVYKKIPLVRAPSPYDRYIEYIADAHKKTALWIIDCGYAPHLACALLCFFGIVSAIFAAGYVSTETNPQDYISGYSVEKTMERLAGPKGPGQEQVYALLEHKNNLPITDPEFLRSAIAWLNDFERTFLIPSSPIRTTATVLKAIEEVSCGERFCSEKKGDEYPYGLIGQFPRQKGDMVHFILPAIDNENRLGKFRKPLWHDNGFRIIIGVAAKTDVALKTVLDTMREFNKNYPDLSIIFFGRNVLFAEIGPYLTWGNIMNKLTSNGTVAFFVCILVWTWQRNKMPTISPVRCGLAAMAPFLFSLSVFLLALFISGKPLDAISSSISAFAISAAGDFQLHFLRSFVRNSEEMAWRSAIEKTFDEEGAIIVKDAIANAAGFLMLIFAYFEPVRELGFVMCISMGLCLIGTLIIMVPLLSMTVATQYAYAADKSPLHLKAAA